MPLDMTMTDGHRRSIEREPARFTMTSDEAAAAQRLVDEALATYPEAECPEFLRDAPVVAHELPRRLRQFLGEMRTRESTAVCVVSGVTVDDAAIGPTPVGRAVAAARAATHREELWLVLCGSLLGDVFGWATQQNGAIVHDIAPVRGHEHSQLGSGSAGLLWWHTEEAFHPYKCDYLGLLCLRNHDRVPTTFATADGMALDDEVLRVLFEPRFLIKPDDSHLTAEQPPDPPTEEERRLLAAAIERMAQMNGRPQRVPVLYGAPSSPYLSIDPFYMEVPEGDAEARAALETLSGAIDARIREVTLTPGEILLIDNRRAVHGRRPFEARYDGTDRWLKRINVTRDLRRSRAHRATSESRVIY
jgi:Fe(II)/alpha-ketoglutarate-dependent arginine beta-hydroxylase